MNSPLPSSNACSNNFLFRSRLPNSTGLGSWTDKGIKWPVMKACLRLLLCLTSASVDTSPAPEKHWSSLAASGKEKQNQMVPNLPKRSTLMLHTWRNFHESTCRSANSLLLGRRAPHHKLGSGTARKPTQRLLRAINRLPGRINP